MKKCENIIHGQIEICEFCQYYDLKYDECEYDRECEYQIIVSIEEQRKELREAYLKENNINIEKKKIRREAWETLGIKKIKNTKPKAFEEIDKVFEKPKTEPQIIGNSAVGETASNSNAYPSQSLSDSLNDLIYNLL